MNYKNIECGIMNNIKEFTAEEQMENWYKLIKFITRSFDILIIKSEEFLPKIKELGIKITNYERI